MHLAPSLQMQSIMLQKAQQLEQLQEHEAAGHVASVVRKQTNAGACSPFYSIWDLSPQDGAVHNEGWPYL